MLRYGANATLLTDSGDNPLNALKNYFLQFPKRLNETNMELYKSICDKLSQALDRVGSVATVKDNDVQKTDDNASTSRKLKTNKNNSTAPTTAYSFDSDSDTETYSKIQDSDDPDSPSPTRSEKRNSRTRIASDSSDSGDNGRKYVQNYKQAISNLRRHSSTNQSNSTPVVVRPKRSALLAVDEVDVDDWLIDDLPNKKKARTDTGIDDQENINAFNVLMKNSNKSMSTKPARRNSSQSNRKSLSQTKIQKSPFETGISPSNHSVDLVEEDDDLYIPSPRHSEKSISTPVPIGEIVLSQSPLAVTPTEDTFKIKIRKEFVFVSVSKEERLSKTIEWLENCASLQYAL